MWVLGLSSGLLYNVKLIAALGVSTFRRKFVVVKLITFIRSEQSSAICLWRSSAIKGELITSVFLEISLSFSFLTLGPVTLRLTTKVQPKLYPVIPEGHKTVERPLGTIYDWHARPWTWILPWLFKKTDGTWIIRWEWTHRVCTLFASALSLRKFDKIRFDLTCYLLSSSTQIGWINLVQLQPLSPRCRYYTEIASNWIKNKLRKNEGDFLRSSPSCEHRIHLGSPRFRRHAWIFIP